ncbi:MAG: asparagine synthase-domain-containing protein [Monoraphidium minutum]|nr:MAG: asparagine synthase-domain-containing protein [Monoraphidium minutum]
MGGQGAVHAWSTTLPLNDGGRPATLLLAASLLQLRGAHRVRTPLAAASGGVLCYNGELFGGLPLPPGANDGEALLAALEAAAPGAVPGVLSALRGPWSLLYWRPATCTLWFGRDWLGRRSLLEALCGGGGGGGGGGGALWSRVARHEWGCAEVRRLRRYERGADLIEPRLGGGGGAGGGGGGGGGSSEDGAAREQEQERAGPSGGGGAEQGGEATAARAPSPSPALQAAARLLLEALRVAVRVRCHAIEAPASSGPGGGAADCASCSGPGAGSAPAGGAAAEPAAPRECASPLLPAAPVLILFSGGVDSSLLAALADDALPRGAAIDLVNARAVLLGHGADEQAAGYGRHRTRHRTAGWPGLASEITLDVTRLWARNLGRDDRLVADHGREARHPFLDEGVAAALLAAPLQLLFDPALPPGGLGAWLFGACLFRNGAGGLGGLPPHAAMETAVATRW